MKKGDRIYVEGRVEYRTWEDREKQTRYTTEIIAREVILLSSRGGGEGSGEFARAKAAAKVRSEERRVGKECRCRWAPCSDKKKRTHAALPRLTEHRTI